MQQDARFSLVDQRSAEQKQQAPEREMIDLGAVFATLWRGKWWIAFITCLAILAGGFYAFIGAVPKYRATAVVILQTQQDRIVDLDSVVGGLSGETSEVNSEVEVLRARSLIGKVVDRLSLIDDPEFNAELRPPARSDVMVDWGKSWAKSLIGLNDAPIVLPPEEAEQRIRDAVVTEVLSSVTVANVPLSLVFRVTVETENAKKSALIADTLVELYVLNQIEVKFAATEQATVWLSERVAELQGTLEEAESKVSAFSASTNLVSVEGLQALERQIKELRDRIDNAAMARDGLVTQLEQLQAAQTREEQSRIAADTQLTRALQRAQADAAFQQVFDNRLSQVLLRKRGDVARAEQQLIALRSSEQELTRDLDQQGEDLITLQQLTREAEATRVLYEYFLARFNETSAQQGIQQADSRILSSAVVPRGPSHPRKSLALAMSAMLGLFLGSGLVLLRELRSSTFRTAFDLERAMGYTVLGQLPTMPSSGRRGVMKYLADKPTSAAAEAYRNLRTSLMLSHVDNPPEVILVTSSVAGEGKTTNSNALAQNFLGLGKKVLLVEGDIRRRTLNDYFDNIPAKGIVSVLSGEQSLEDAVFQSTGFGADILSGEKTTTNAADLFSSQAFKTFIATARASYDIVIIDTPPVLVVPDARIMADEADAVLFTVRWDNTPKDQVEESMRLFHNSGQRITGFALSQVSPRGMKKYGYGGKYGAYAAYGSKYYTN